MQTQKGHAYIRDNRDRTQTKVWARGLSVHQARGRAFVKAQDRCTTMNKREGWSRFVPLS